jgi:ribonucleotide monophosphatase NagD (HAD superfamily)
MPGGGIPDARATIAALEHITGRTPEQLAGKPSALMMQVALDRLDLRPERCMLVGDRLETDMLMGRQAGMQTAVVLTGASRRADIDQMAQPPDFVLETIGDLPLLLEQLDRLP